MIQDLLQENDISSVIKHRHRSDFSGTYILVRDNITVVESPVTQLASKNCAPFTKCITKIDGTTIDVLKT